MTAAPPAALDPTLSHTRGETDTPLLETTIGDNFDATAERFAEREALVDVAQGKRWTYAELRADVDRLARALLAIGVDTGDRVGIWAPNCSEWTLVQYATAKIGAILVNINPSYRSHELQYVLEPGRHPHPRRGGVVQVAATTRAMVDEVRAEVDGLERVVYFGTSDWADLARPCRRGRPGASSRHPGGADEHRPDQHPVHLGHHGIPQGCDAQPPQHPQQRLLRRRALRLHRGRPGLHPGALLPLLRHGHGQPRVHDARCLHGHPGARLRPRRDPAGHRRTRSSPRSTACRRCSSPSWTCPTSRLRPLDAAHRHHGRIPLPRRADEAAHRRAGIEEMTICYGMTETSPVSTQNRTDDTSTEGRHRRTRRAAPRDQDRRPGDRARRCRAAAGEFCTKGYSVMLGYWDQPEKTAEAIEDGWMHTGDIGVMRRRRLRRDHRPHQGHGHPRRRERLPARDRGVPLHPP